MFPEALTLPPAPSSALAFVTTLHFALALLRNHRRIAGGAFNPLAIVSLGFAMVPWVLPSVVGLASGLVAHAAWFGICEWLFRLPAHIPSPSSQATAPAPPRVARAAQAPPAVERASTAFVRVPILAAFDETADIRTIRMARPEGFDFTAGQFLTLRITTDGKEQARCYSISSAPGVKGYLEVSIKRQGIVSNALHATARPGGMLSIRKPNGKFTYPSGDDRPIVLLAGGVGITPLMSMLRHAVAAEPARPVTLLYGAREEEDFAFRDELASISRRHPQARVFLAASRAVSVQPNVYPGRIDEALIQIAAPDVAHSICLICGPAAMIDGAKALLASRGVPAPQIRYEMFEAAVASSAMVGAATSRSAAPARAAHQMRCAVSGKTVSVPPGQTVLDAAENAGVSVPSLCRAGVCGTCRTRVTQGDVDCTSTTLDEADRGEGYVLACVATPRSACTVEL